MGTNRKLQKRKPVVMPEDQQFKYDMERLEDTPDDVAIVSIDLRKFIPARQPDHFYEHQRAVLKAAEQIHARMMVMGREKTPWHELDLDTYDSYCIAAYNSLNAALQCGIVFVAEEG